MSAAAARRRKQLAARASAQQDKGSNNLGAQLDRLLAEEEEGGGGAMPEEAAYEALQLAQSAVRKRVKEGEFGGACDLAYAASLALLRKRRVAVAGQLLALLVEVLRETRTAETEEWVGRLAELHGAHQIAMEADDEAAAAPGRQERNRLQRLQRSWLLAAVQWSSELGAVRYGHNELQGLLGQQCWDLSQIREDEDDEEEKAEITELQCDAVQHMALAERPDVIVGWLQTLPAPTEEETTAGHDCPPALRDGLLTRALLLFCAVENLRDANALLRAYIEAVEERDIRELAASYTNKSDGRAPSHAVFGCMLLRICEKDARTGPLFQWLMRSFRRELDGLPKPQAVLSYTTKIGKVYFNIQPPPSAFNMMENMMGMMGGGGMGGMPPGGMDPRMMQQAMAALQKGGGM